MHDDTETSAVNVNIRLLKIHNLYLCFRYELIFEDAESQSCLERSLGVSLLRKMKNQVSGVVILVFNFVFSPFKPFR